MIKRIVKMTFREEQTADFIAIFDESKDAIRAFPGCLHLELLQSQSPDNIFFTYSWWEGESDLERYRQSELFKSTWARTKALFAVPAKAWTVQSLRQLD